MVRTLHLLATSNLTDNILIGLENILLLSLAGLLTAWLDVFKSYNLDITGS